MAPLLTILLLSLEAKAQTITREELRATIVHMQKLAKEAVADADAARRKLAETTVALELTRQSLRTSKEATEALKGDVDKLSAWGVEQQREKADAQARLADEKKAHEATLARYHRLKLIAALVVAALALLASLQLGAITSFAGPYAALIPIAAAAGGFSLIWFLL